jgi:ABC-type sugar transport system ATPase subunit
MARIILQNVCKAFAKDTAVNDLNIEIGDGELLVLLGPSGCGKTTTMNMIAGLTQPSSGRIIFNNEDVTHLSPHQRNIAMVFQSSLLYPHLTAKQNIYMSLKRSGLPKDEIERRIQGAAATLDVTRILHKLPSELSGGERQRVATAKAIVRHPACFLLDEPLAALDAALRLALRSELVNLQKRLNTTMIFVTHDQIEAMTMGDRIGVMRAGRLEQIGTPDEIYNRPETLFVAGFVGSPPMNFLSGAVEQVNGRATFTNNFLRFPLLDGYLGAAPRRDVTFAIRPQYMRIQSQASPDAVPVSVYALEYLGNESVVIADTPDKTRVRAVVPPGFHASIGEVLHFTFDPAMVRLFDQKTERPLRVAS